MVLCTQIFIDCIQLLVGGFTLLKSLPKDERSLKQKEFLPGSRKFLEDTVDYIKKNIVDQNPRALMDWDAFLKMAPGNLFLYIIFFPLSS